ncbi:MAG: amidohydrolase family protein [Chloroflexi bacterium]|nr:amidohydrolase family protein [Chloroflexota bacterium]
MPPSPRDRVWIDTHVHVIDSARWPMSSNKGYRANAAERGTAEELLACMDAHGITGAVVVQPSGYGTDHRALHDALARAPERLRGIGMVEAPTDVAALARQPGIVGLRLNVTDYDGGVLPRERLERLLGAAAEAGLLVQILASAEVLAGHADALASSSAPVVLDHLGSPRSGDGVAASAFEALCGLAARNPWIYAKLSAPFRIDASGAPWPEAAAVARRLLQAFGPERCIWGSDWPFIALGDAPRPAYADLLAWVDTAVGLHLEHVMSLTPQRLFGLTAAAA